MPGSTLEIFERLKQNYGFQKGDRHMRKEALLEQWKQLYEVATRIKLKPWEKLWDMDLIAVEVELRRTALVFYKLYLVGAETVARYSFI